MDAGGSTNGPMIPESERAGPLSVSVIIPAYNAEAFVREALESVLAQTHGPLEVIVVNDGSTDGTAAILGEFLGRIRVVDQPNRGLPAARNAGAAASHGEWLAFLDADDYWSPRKIERQLLLADAGVDLIYTDRYNVGDRGSVPELHSDLHTLYEGDLFLDLLLHGNRITASSVIFRSEAFRALGGFFEELRATEDYDLWIRYAADGQVRVCREPLVYYRHHADNMSRDPRRMWEARLAVVRRALELPRGRSLAPALRRRIWSRAWTSNGADAARNGHRLKAVAAYARAASFWPFVIRPYKESLKACLGIS